MTATADTARRRPGSGAPAMSGGSDRFDAQPFDAQPWEFAAKASEEERRRQAAFRAELEATGRVRIGEGGYASPRAYLVGSAISLGRDCLVAAGVRLDGSVTTGDNCSFNLNATAAGTISLGNDVRVAAGAGLWGFDHAHGDPDRPIAKQGTVSQGIEVGDDVWIGHNAVVTDGVRIGSHVVVAAGAVVTRDLPDYALAAGNPARVIRDRRETGANGRQAAVDALLRLADRAGRDWRTVLERARTDGRPGFLHSDPRNDDGDPVRPDCDAIQIAAMFGEVADGRDKTGWIDALRARQDPASGLFAKDSGGPAPSGGGSGSDWRPENCHLYDVLCVPYALECLGGAPAHRIAWADGVFERLPDRLDALPWRDRGWHSGAMVDTLGTAAYVNARYFGGQPEMAALAGELAVRIDPNSGMWSPPAGEDWLQPVNGYYRLVRGTFAQFGLPLPWPRATIDTVLAHAARNGHFEQAGRTACNMLDVVHPLMVCAEQTDHRAGDIDACIARLAVGIDELWQEGAGIPFVEGEPPGLQGTEMWLSIAALMARHLGIAERMGFALAGIHRFEPAWRLPGEP